MRKLLASLLQPAEMQVKETFTTVKLIKQKIFYATELCKKAPPDE